MKKIMLKSGQIVLGENGERLKVEKGDYLVEDSMGRLSLLKKWLKDALEGGFEWVIPEDVEKWEVAGSGLQGLIDEMGNGFFKNLLWEAEEKGWVYPVRIKNAEKEAFRLKSSKEKRRLRNRLKKEDPITKNPFTEVFFYLPAIKD